MPFEYKSPLITANKLASSIPIRVRLALAVNIRVNCLIGLQHNW